MQFYAPPWFHSSFIGHPTRNSLRWPSADELASPKFLVSVLQH